MIPQADPSRRFDALSGNLRTRFAPDDDVTDRLLRISAVVLMVALVAQAFYVLWLGLFQPLMDMFAFRQTQTALTAYWLWKGGAWFAYETPVLGQPWSIPFEFPLYQYLVALLRLVGIPIDVGGRLVSFSFYLGCLWPLWLLFRTLRLGRYAYLAVSILFLSSPLYLYWGRTVMIESCALFFGLLWLALLVYFFAKPHPTTLLWTILAGTTCALVKSSTFPAFLVLGGILFLYRILRDGLSAPHRRTLILAVVAFLIPLLVAYGWARYADVVKSGNSFGRLMTASAIPVWYFGTWSQRISSHFWLDVVLMRVMPDIFGYGFPIAVAVAGAALASRRFAAPMIAAMVAFFVPFALFTNLHFIHNYYQNANAIFVLAAVGLGIASVAEAGYRRMAAIFLITLVVLQAVFFWRKDAPFVTANFTPDQRLQIALMAKNKTPPDGSLIVLGADWSSEIPYYAERKSLALPYWSPPALFQRLFEDPQAFLGDRPLAAIVYCTTNKPPPAVAPLVDHFVADREVLGKSGSCQLLAAQR